MGEVQENNQYEKAMKWRSDLARKLLEINDNKGYRHFDWFDPTVGFTENVKTATYEMVVKQNNFYLNQCDIMVVNLDMLHKSPGTIYEIIYFYLDNKPIIAFNNDEFALAPHINVGITEFVEDIDAVAECLQNYYIQ